MKVCVLLDDILEIDVDSIVNPTNKWLLAGGGFCGAIYKRAGKTELERETRGICESQYNGSVPCGEVIVSGAYGLRHKLILHAVVPKYLIDPIEMLSVCYANALREADKNGCKSIAFPALGIGINRIPLQLTFPHINKALQEFESKNISKVVFCLNDKSLVSIYQKSVEYK
ncbi:MAG: macro domain-containing protein [Candidatus Moranbacteria bacterium]|nr:macro domain-containing protein [Candidatus Moranbacteria bacterium]